MKKRKKKLKRRLNGLKLKKKNLRELKIAMRMRPLFFRARRQTKEAQRKVVVKLLRMRK